MIAIRHANKNDSERLQQLHKLIFSNDLQFDSDVNVEWVNSKDGKAYFDSLLNNQKSLCLVAEEKKKLIGYLAATSKSFEDRKSKYIEIQNLGIVSEYRLQGIGQQLIDQCFEWAKAKGYKKVWLRCYSKNTQALNFYKKNKFSEISVSLERDV